MSGLVRWLVGGWLTACYTENSMHATGVRVRLLLSNSCSLPTINALMRRQNGSHFADDIFKRIILNEDVRIFIKISRKFGPKGPDYNSVALVQTMAESMVVRLLNYACVARPQWVDIPHPHPNDKYTHIPLLSVSWSLLTANIDVSIWYIYKHSLSFVYMIGASRQSIVTYDAITGILTNVYAHLEWWLRKFDIVEKTMRVEGFKLWYIV